MAQEPEPSVVIHMTLSAGAAGGAEVYVQQIGETVAAVIAGAQKVAVSEPEAAVALLANAGANFEAVSRAWWEAAGRVHAARARLQQEGGQG